MAVHKYFANKPVRRRFFALATAYAIVLSSLFANIGAVRAAVGAPLDPWSVICHAPGPAQPAPAGDERNSRTCVDGCCIGCLMLLATVPPPAAEAVPAAATAGQILKPLPVTVLARHFEHKSYLSRAPPSRV